MLTINPSRALSLALAAAALTATALPAQAAGEVEGDAIAVQYSDLNLATPEGQQVLEQRLDRAARNVCGVDQSRLGTRLASRAATACYNDTRARLDQHFAQLISGERQGG